MPNIQLVGFEKVFLQAGASIHLEIDIDHEQMAVWTDTQGFVLEIGESATHIVMTRVFVVLLSLSRRLLFRSRKLYDCMTGLQTVWNFINVRFTTLEKLHLRYTPL